MKFFLLIPIGAKMSRFLAVFLFSLFFATFFFPVSRVLHKGSVLDASSLWKQTLVENRKICTSPLANGYRRDAHFISHGILCCQKGDLEL